MEYQNPIIVSDISDPDVICVNGDYFMVASSFNYQPGVPVYHSLDMINWELVNYVVERFDFEEFSSVIHGGGAWAVSLRYNNGIFYCLIPIIDKGIYVCETKNPFDKWSKPRLLISGSGLEDPCPLWHEGKCYVAVAFAKSRAGFNSVIAVYETDNQLTKVQSNGYKIVYDGQKENPTIEGPKFYQKDGYIYILAPAGGVRYGWQTALRSKNVYGPYEAKTVLKQGNSAINGPHQGALVKVYGKDDWFFYHFRDMLSYGRVLYLQPVKWIDGWPLMGKIDINLSSFEPVEKGEIDIEPIKKSNFIRPTTKRQIPLEYQTPATLKKEWFEFGKDIRLNLIKNQKDDFSLIENQLSKKIEHFNSLTTVKIDFFPEKYGDEICFSVMGKNYFVISAIKRDKLYVELKEGEFNQKLRTIKAVPIFDGKIEFSLKLERVGEDGQTCVFGINGKYFDNCFNVTAGRWIGARLNLFGISKEDSLGYALLKEFKTEKLTKTTQ